MNFFLTQVLLPIALGTGVLASLIAFALVMRRWGDLVLAAVIFLIFAYLFGVIILNPPNQNERTPDSRIER
jgi:hypothetical protein